MRGEDYSPLDFCSMYCGSPPHARGRRFFNGSRIFHDVDHPRMRGEDVGFSFNIRLRMGSPPHARGRLTLPDEDMPDGGITPACAGKTTTRDV